MARVLLVEDDNNLREIFEMRLQAEGYQTLTAADGEEGLAVAMKEKPDLIIADVMMPKLSGFEMLETLRASPEMKNTKVIMMTALGQAEDRTRGVSLSVVKYLVKSQVTLEDFVRVVREVVRPDQAGAAASAAPAINPDDVLSTTNKAESEQAMQDDNTQQPNPSTDGAAGGNPMSGDSTGGGTAGANGQMSTAEEKDQVNQQVNDFASGAPSMPDPAAGSPMGGGSAGTSTGGGDMPASSPPAGGSEPGAEPAPDSSGNLPGPTPGSEGSSQV